MKIKKGDTIQLKFPNEPIYPYTFVVVGIYPENGLTKGRIDIVESKNYKKFLKGKINPLGIPITYAKKIT